MIYTGTNSRIFLETGLDLSQAQATQIRWRRKGVSGVWNASVDGTKIYYDTSKSDLDESGTWEFQAIVTINNNLYKGEISKIKIEKPIPEV